MKISILGPLLVTDQSGAPLDLTLEPKQEVLLLALAANADRGISLSELTVVVYGSTETALYKRSIESLTSRLRATLRTLSPVSGEMIPRAKSGFYRAMLEPDQVDALRFLRLAEHLLARWTTIDPAERRLLCRRAIAEWRDNPVRIYGDASPVAEELFRRFTSSLAELGQRYARLLVEEQRVDEARRELSHLVQLLPGHVRVARLHEELEAHLSPTASGSSSAWPAGTGEGLPAVQELCERLLSTGALPLEALAVSAHNLDRIYLVDRVAPDHEVKVALPFEEPGGSGANTISGLAQLGRAVATTGIVADDDEGAALLESLKATGVDCGSVLVAPAGERVRSGHSIVFSDPRGVRSIYVHPGVNESLAERLKATPGALTHLEDQIRRARIVHFTSFTSPAELRLQEYLTSIVPAETVLSLNPGALYASLGLDRLDSILSRANVLFLYEQNLRELVENSAAPPRENEEQGLRSDLSRLYAWKRMKGYGQPLVTLVKRYRSQVSGENGPEYLVLVSGRFSVEEMIGTQARIGSRNQSPVKDSTGAGDGMAAGLLFGLLTGSTLRECADLSYLVAILVSDEVGARPGQPTLGGLRDAWSRYFPGVAEPAFLRPHPTEPAARAEGARFRR